ncbi:hypothetical protein PCANC_15007 [Puccinia coronata f. sp. avenae]|uniref:Secreted protein n=1 Tax=Puccinia coronata f. sp. avenae TaxID=200324 RepID=A0A2N5STJ5_9BASI|nr:hypothetical protein PCANC_15007 [Puccinia coronata f. sp. avenae]
MVAFLALVSTKLQLGLCPRGAGPKVADLNTVEKCRRRKARTLENEPRKNKTNMLRGHRITGRNTNVKEEQSAG